VLSVWVTWFSHVFDYSYVRQRVVRKYRQGTRFREFMGVVLMCCRYGACRGTTMLSGQRNPPKR
jgi:hypothetical protein